MVNARTNQIKITYREFFFYLFFGLMFGMRMWGIYEGRLLYAPLLAIGMLFWMISIVLDEHSLFEYVVIAVMMGLSAYIYLNTGDKGLVLYFALVLGMKGIDPKRVFKVGVIIGLSGIACMSFLAAFGIIEDVAFIQFRPIVGYIFRRSLGSPHPNTLSSSFAILVMMVMYIIDFTDKVKVIKYTIFLCAVSLYIFLFSVSRTGLIITIGFLGVNLFYVYRSHLGKVEKIAVTILLPVIWIVSVVGPIMASENAIETIKKVDGNFGSRWEVGKYYWVNNKPTLFGQILKRPTASNKALSYYGIDMSQLYLLLQLGVVAFVIINMLWIFLLYQEAKCNMVQELIITVFLLIMGISDPFLYNISFKNIAFVFIGALLYKQILICLKYLPEFMTKPIILLNRQIGKKYLQFKFGSVKKEYKGLTAFLSNKKYILAGGMLSILALVAIGIYVMTPTPQYVLLDRNSGEWKAHVNESLIGRTYTKQEIRDIKETGNIVLNYSDDKELMYTYFSDEQSGITGGFFAPNAGRVEKLRRSISVFFWGSIATVLILFICKLEERKCKQ